jgi:hypothetical protein
MWDRRRFPSHKAHSIVQRWNRHSAHQHNQGHRDGLKLRGDAYRGQRRSRKSTYKDTYRHKRTHMLQNTETDRPMLDLQG